jgi:glycerol-1-phosphate dehydrogenase [NAD(P)+]
MPLLARTILTPLTIEISAGAVRRIGAVLTDARVTAGGRPAVVLGPGIGAELADKVGKDLPTAEIIRIEAGTVESAMALADRLHPHSYEIVVGIGGGKIIDTVKYAATLRGLPMVAVATSLAHDGLASPVATLRHGNASPSYGVHIPIAVIVDLDLVARSPIGQIRSGVGDALSNLSACADWELSHAERGEPIDGLALSLARTGAQAVLNHPGETAGSDFLTTLAEALILGGVAMAVAGSSRPCSGACHEIAHALAELHPAAASHGTGAGLGALFATYLRTRYSSGSHDSFDRMSAALARHGVPRKPAEIGLTPGQFAAVVAHAPATRPGRFTVLEHLSLDGTTLAAAVDEYIDAIG